MIYVGLDVSLNSIAICAVDEAGRLIQEGATLADAPSIVQYLEPWAAQVERVGLEAGPTSEWLTANLIELGLPAVSLEARQVKAALSAINRRWTGPPIGILFHAETQIGAAGAGRYTIVRAGGVGIVATGGCGALRVAGSSCYYGRVPGCTSGGARDARPCGAK